MKKHLCEICGETDPTKFKIGYKGICKVCMGNKYGKKKPIKLKVYRFKKYKQQKEPRYSQENFINNVKKFHGDKYSFEKTTYGGRDNKVIITCKKHQHDFEVKPSSLIRKKGGHNPIVGSCPKCQTEYYSNIRKPKKEKILKPKFIFRNDEKYYPCEIHGEVLVGKTRHFNQGCPICNIENHAKSIKHPNIIIDKYHKYYICDIHGKIPIGKNRNGTDGCPTCNIERSNKKQKEKYNFVSLEEAKARVARLGIKSTVEYRLWKKRTCQIDMPSNPDKAYKISSYEFFNVKKHDRMSGGERRIYYFLKKKNYNFETQKMFPDCRNKSLLRFDFYLSEYNILIEFDGEQHFKMSNFSTSIEINKKKFDQGKINDEIKTKYCKDNNIPLIRLDNYHLINNILEWELDYEINRIVVERIISEK
jgi:hypothetical protein